MSDTAVSTTIPQCIVDDDVDANLAKAEPGCTAAQLMEWIVAAFPHATKIHMETPWDPDYAPDRPFVLKVYGATSDMREFCDASFGFSEKLRARFPKAALGAAVIPAD